MGGRVSLVKARTCPARPSWLRESPNPVKTGVRAGSSVARDTLRTRGYLKISNISYDFRDKTILDIGSSTGGFTAYALDNGAKKVIAVEKGTNQMAKPLRYDPRIDLREKTDIFSVDRSTLPEIDLILADVSFISLKPILKHAKNHIASQKTDFLVMLKPQFEAHPDELVKGIIKNEKIRRKIIKDFEFWLKENGFIIRAKRDNALSGKNGNLERFYYLALAKN